MKVITAEFMLSASDPAVGVGYPPDGPPEIAFAGRSNVGKSTLLQALMQRRGLVRVSSTPGRTRLVNFFRLEIEPKPNERRELRFVDLPGYGYAKVSKSEREQWLPFIDQYLAQRPSLRALVMLVDARRSDDPGVKGQPPFFDETEIVKYIQGRNVKVFAVMTKADKLPKHERKLALAQVQRSLGMPAIAVSATDGDGLDELWRRLVVALEPPGS
ncbi:MAG TPA: ribosome biogenesis GTP-binding protein YihA/YsxC [Polyangia bacterium]|nr:ribosome biogenesis GTP-binding protein YihA/YsxC [Polyangia bacterium]